MKARTWPVLALGFGTLVFLTMLFGLDSWRRASRIYTAALSIHRSHARAEQALHEIESGIYLSGIFSRDFLVDASPLAAGFQRQQLLSIRSSMETELSTLNESTVTADKQVVERLRREVDRYWASMAPIFNWTARQKLILSGNFLRHQVLPRRAAVLAIAAEARALNAADLADRQKMMDRQLADFRGSSQRALALVLALGVVVSCASIFRVSRLESRAREQHEHSERAELEMRRLSQQLVRAQEDERRNLSRELHDEVGQTLTALRLELGNLEKLRNSTGDGFRQHLEDAKQLAADTLRSVRNIAMGLRPALLDDLGLGPALEWQAREFSRRSSIPVEVEIGGLLSELPDAYRTCVYRVVQEALTNCVRHAGARHIHVALGTEGGRLHVAVQDDGRGMPPQQARERRGSHLGLVGMEERIRDLGGTLAIESQPGKGTSLQAWIPLPQETTA